MSERGQWGDHAITMDDAPPWLGPTEYAFSVQLLRDADPRYLIAGDGVVVITALAAVAVAGAGLRPGRYRVVRMVDADDDLGPGRWAVARWDGAGHG